TQIDAAVTALRITEFDMQLEIGELLIGDDIRSRSRAAQDTVFHHPLIGLTRNMPAGKILSIEQGDRPTPYRLTLTLQRRRAVTYPVKRFAAGRHHRTDEAISLHTSLDI